MSMVTPLQLLLFGSRVVKSDGTNVVLDEWLDNTQFILCQILLLKIWISTVYSDLVHILYKYNV